MTNICIRNGFNLNTCVHKSYVNIRHKQFFQKMTAKISWFEILLDAIF